MKTLAVIGFILTTLIVGFSCQSNQKSGKNTSDLVGAYEYTGNLEGMALSDESHFAFTYKRKSGKPDSLLTVEEKYNAIQANAGTWTLKDSIVTLTITFSKDPKMVGTVHRFVYNNIGNKHTYRIIDKNGKTIREGFAIKIK